MEEQLSIEQQLRYHPELINTTDRLRFVFNYLAGDDCEMIHVNETVLDDGSHGYIKDEILRVFDLVTCNNQSSKFILHVSHMEEKVREVTEDGYIPNFIKGEDKEYGWGEIPTGIMDAIVSQIDSKVSVDVLEYVDRICELNSYVENQKFPDSFVRFDVEDAPYIESFPLEQRIVSSTAVVPCFTSVYDDRRNSVTYDNGYTVECHIDTFDGISFLKDGEYVIEDVSIDDILKWKERSDEFLRLLDTIESELMDLRHTLNGIDDDIDSVKLEMAKITGLK